MNDGVALTSALHPGSKPLLTAETVKAFAIKCAKGNNGGEWATHYTEEQKNFWRQFVQSLAWAIMDEMDLGTDDHDFGDAVVTEEIEVTPNLGGLRIGR